MMSFLRKLKTRSGRLIIMMILTGVYFIVEIVVGHITNSIALVTDSFHMLSDILALIIALFAIYMAKQKSKKNTFGWVRAEILGALVNSVFLLALCFTIIVDSIQRMISPEVISDVNLLLIVGAVGLFVNLVGMVLFSNVHGYHHGHSHTMGGAVENNDLPKLEHQISLHETPMSRYPERALSAISTPQEDNNLKNKGLNMKAVFLHVLADALGSVVVMISGLIIKYVPKNIDDTYKKWVHYVDPVLSLLMVILIVASTIPLFKESALVLLQTVPNSIDISKFRQNLLSAIPEIQQIHDLHVWQLSSNEIIGSAHVTRNSLSDYMSVANNIRKFFHNAGIKSSTIQVECDTFQSDQTDTMCLLSCQDVSCSDQCIKDETLGDRALTNDADTARRWHANRYRYSDFICSTVRVQVAKNDTTFEDDSFEIYVGDERAHGHQLRNTMSSCKESV